MMAQYRSLQDKDFVSNLYLGKIGVATTDVAINILIVLLDRKNGNVRNQFQGCGSLAGVWRRTYMLWKPGERM